MSLRGKCIQRIVAVTKDGKSHRRASLKERLPKLKTSKPIHKSIMVSNTIAQSNIVYLNFTETIEYSMVAVISYRFY